MYVPLHVLCGIMTFAYCSLQYSTIQCLFASNAQLTNPHSWTLVFLSKRLQATAGNRALARSPPRPVMTLPTTSFPVASGHCTARPSNDGPWLSCTPSWLPSGACSSGRVAEITARARAASIHHNRERQQHGHYARKQPLTVPAPRLQ